MRIRSILMKQPLQIVISFSFQRSILHVPVQLASDSTTSSLFATAILTKLALKCGPSQLGKCFFSLNTALRDYQSSHAYEDHRLLRQTQWIPIIDWSTNLSINSRQDVQIQWASKHPCDPLSAPNDSSMSPRRSLTALSALLFPPPSTLSARDVVTHPRTNIRKIEKAVRRGRMPIISSR